VGESAEHRRGRTAGVQEERPDGEPVATVALLPAPGMPAELAKAVARRLSREVSPRGLSIEVLDELLVEDGDAESVVAAAARVRERTGADAIIALTDVPLREHLRPLVAAVGLRDDVAVVSVPALGVGRLQPRVETAVMRLAEELLRPAPTAVVRGGGQQPRASGLLPSTREVDRGERVAVRYLIPAGVGHLRLLAGMVRANRPWRALAGLSSAVVAAFATGAYALLSVTIWELSGALPWSRMLLLMVGAVASVVVWLIVAHRLWERPGERRPPKDARLYNAATTLTLTVAVLVAYAALFALIFVIALTLIDSGVYRRNAGADLDTTGYLAIAWLGASIATVAGGLGSGLESVDEVRDAAYGHHQRRRRPRLDEGERTNQR